jgi:hypothetical protein
MGRREGERETARERETERERRNKGLGEESESDRDGQLPALSQARKSEAYTFSLYFSPRPLPVFFQKRMQKSQSICLKTLI